MEDDHQRLVPLFVYLARTYDTAPVGLLTRVYRHGERPTGAVLLAQTHDVWRHYSLRGVYDGLYANDSFLTPMAIDYADAGLAWRIWLNPKATKLMPQRPTAASCICSVPTRRAPGCPAAPEWPLYGSRLSPSVAYPPAGAPLSSAREAHLPKTP